MKPFRYFVPTEIILGPGCFNTLGDRAARVGSKALIVTGRHSARQSGALARALRQLPGAAVFDQVDENPETSACDAGGEVCRRERCDLVVAIGGGSPMDAGKAIALMARNPGPCSNYFGSDLYANPNLPVIAVPTTAGTGSEVTPYAVLTDTDGNSKKTVAGRSLFPVVALLDPELTVTMPRHVTVNTGLDALSQAMEGLVSHKSTPMSDSLAIEACRIVKEWLPCAANRPSDLEARAQMLYAAMLSGCVIAQSGTTLVHGMGYHYTLRFGIAHGLANALLLTPLFQHNANFLPEKVAAIADALGYPARPEPNHAAAAITSALHALFTQLAVSPAAKDAGVHEDAIPEMAKIIFDDKPRAKNQPGHLSLQDIQRFFEQSFSGATG
jgi:alcohol dehydrogenase class IV